MSKTIGVDTHIHIDVLLAAGGVVQQAPEGGRRTPTQGATTVPACHAAPLELGGIAGGGGYG